MIIEIFLALLLGVTFGTFTGLIPGIHINMISVFIISFSAYFLNFVSAIVIISFLIAMAITHTFIDFIPSIFLGAPDEDSFLAILPGHEMLNEGKGYEAVVYTAYGGLFALAIILIFTPLFMLFLPKLYPYAEKIMPFILILTCSFLIYFEKSKKIWALIIFFLSGILGMVTLNLPIKESLLPLFTGLFGVSSLITSISKKQKLPKQKISKLNEIRISNNSLFKSIFASVLASPLCSFLPGLGSGQAAIIGSEVVGEINKKEFLILLGIINTTVMGLSFITLYLINKARTGVAEAISKILELNNRDLIIILTVILIVGTLSFFLSLILARLFSKIVNLIDYTILSLVVIALVINVNLIFSGFVGLLVLGVSSCLGLTCIYLGIKRTHLMGCLLIPTIMLYLL